MVDLKTMWQTAKNGTVRSKTWEQRNDGWRLEMLDDGQAEEWIAKMFGESAVGRAWRDLPNAIFVSTAC